MLANKPNKLHFAGAFVRPTTPNRRLASAVFVGPCGQRIKQYEIGPVSRTSPRRVFCAGTRSRYRSVIIFWVVLCLGHQPSRVPSGGVTVCSRVDRSIVTFAAQLRTCPTFGGCSRRQFLALSVYVSQNSR